MLRVLLYYWLYVFSQPRMHMLKSYHLKPWKQWSVTVQSRRVRTSKAI